MRFLRSAFGKQSRKHDTITASTVKDALTMAGAKNVLGTDLAMCCTDPMTGYYRNGVCQNGPGDFGLHIVCARMTDEFLEFTSRRGNDLSTPNPESGFPGLQAGDQWCLCVSRWVEAVREGVAPPVILEATHISALEFVELHVLKAHAVTHEA